MMVRLCEHCGKSFNAFPRDIRKGYGRFCSLACFGQTRKRSLIGYDRKRFERKFIPEPMSGCYLWLGLSQKNTDNYHQAIFSHTLAPRVAWELAYGPIPEGLCVLHRCDNPMCVCPEHLFLGTKKQNTADMVRKGRHRYETRKGELNNRASITAEQAKAIMSAQGSYNTIARQFGVSKTVVANIRRGFTWRHV